MRGTRRVHSLIIRETGIVNNQMHFIFACQSVAKIDTANLLICISGKLLQILCTLCTSTLLLLDILV